MQNIAEFRIIGRIGKVEVKEKVTYLSVASNYNRKDGDEWKTDAHWNNVTLFDKLAKRLTASKGDLVHITGPRPPEQLRSERHHPLRGRSDRRGCRNPRPQGRQPGRRQGRVIGARGG